MRKDQLERSLEDLFAGFTPPPPESKAEGLPTTAEPLGAPPEPKVEPASPLAVAEEVPRPAQEPVAVQPGPLEGQAAEVPGRPLLAARTTNIRAQLVGNTLVILAVFLWTGLLLSSAASRLNRAANVLAEETARANTALQVGRAAAELFVVIGQGALTQDAGLFTPAIGEARERLREAQEQLLGSMSAVPVADPVWGELSRLRASAGHVDEIADLLTQRAAEGDWQEIAHYQVALVPFYRQRITDAVEQVTRLTGERYAAATAEAQAARRLMQDVSITWGLLFGLVLLLTSFSTVRSIAQPAETLTRAAARLAAGHLEERVSIERADELGRLATAFNEMAQRLQASYAELEQRVIERTRELQEANVALQRRATQLEASFEVSRAITSIFNVDELLRRTVNLIRERFGFYHAAIFLLDPKGEWAVLREATGEAGAEMKALGHRLSVGETSMVGWTALHRQARIALDVGEDAVHFANPLLPYTRSEVTLPLTVGERLLGVLDVQSTEEAAFDQEDVRVLQSMADQVAVAIENARRVSEEAAILEASSPIYRLSHHLATATTVSEVAGVIMDSVAQTEADGCVLLGLEFASQGEPESVLRLGTWLRGHEPQSEPGLRMPIAQLPVPLEMVGTPWTVERVEQDRRVSREALGLLGAAEARALVNVPLRARDRLVGQVLVFRTTPGPFSESTLRLYEVLGSQTAVALERARLLEETSRRAAQERLVSQITGRVRASTEVSSILRTAILELGRALGASDGLIRLGSGDGDGGAWTDQGGGG